MDFLVGISVGVGLCGMVSGLAGLLSGGSSRCRGGYQRPGPNAPPPPRRKQ